MTATILVVDDEPDLQALITQKFRRQIRDGAFGFVFAHDGIEALAKLDEHGAVDMILTDINMPRMDGLTFLAKLEEAGRQVSTVVVSAYGDMQNIRSAMNKGAFDFLTKPIDLGDLEATIGKTMRHVEVLRDARRRQAEAERAHASLSRYFSPNLVERLGGDAAALGLAGERREVASMFTDVAGFTRLVEGTEPGTLADLLNDYLGTMTDVVFEHDGTVAKIVGDAMHVLFGAPGDQADHADRAVACALALDARSETFRAAWAERGVALGVTRIGIHAGPAIVGNFGGGRFFDYTAYGDTINISARLEDANKQLGTRICASHEIAARATTFRGRPVGNLVLRGKTEPLKAYEPLTEEAAAAPAIAAYQEAYRKLEAGEPTAMPAFAALVGAAPDDRLVSFHLKRLLNGGSGPRIALD